MQGTAQAKFVRNNLEGLTKTDHYELNKPIRFRGRRGEEVVLHETHNVLVVYGIDPLATESTILPFEPVNGVEWREASQVSDGAPLKWEVVKTNAAPRTIEGRSVERLRAFGYSKDCGCGNKN